MRLILTAGAHSIDYDQPESATPDGLDTLLRQLQVALSTMVTLITVPDQPGDSAPEP